VFLTVRQQRWKLPALPYPSQKLIGHLLKWDYQSDHRSKSWEFTIAEQREEILEILTDNPSLRPYLEEAVAKGYLKGMRLVLKETNGPKVDLPQSCPHAIAQLLDSSFPSDFP